MADMHTDTQHCYPGVVYRNKAIWLDVLSHTAENAPLFYRRSECAIKLRAQHLQMLCHGTAF